MKLHRAFATLLLLAVSAAVPRAAIAAESYDNCSGFIDTLPTTVSTQGVWCLRHDLATNIASGNAIEIATNNVTVDCNDFKLGGLAAGSASLAYGIRAQDRQNSTVRHCNIRGFYAGIVLILGGGHLVEDNRLDNNLGAGISTSSGGDSTNSLVRHNRVFDTGGATAAGAHYEVFGIVADGDVIDNTIEDVSPVANGAEANTSIKVYGIAGSSLGTQISGNRIRGVASKGTVNHGGYAYGIHAVAYQTVTDNRIANVAGTATFSYGIRNEAAAAFCTGNTVAGVQGTAIAGCSVPNPNDNLVYP